MLSFVMWIDLLVKFFMEDMKDYNIKDWKKNLDLLFWWLILHFYRSFVNVIRSLSFCKQRKISKFNVFNRSFSVLKKFIQKLLNSNTFDRNSIWCLQISIAGLVFMPRKNISRRVYYSQIKRSKFKSGNKLRADQQPDLIFRRNRSLRSPMVVWSESCEYDRCIGDLENILGANLRWNQGVLVKLRK